MMQASHIHHHLQMVQRSGQAHGINKYIQHCQKNCIVIHCPACPELGWNIDLEILQSASKSEKCVVFHLNFMWFSVSDIISRHKYTLFLDCNGMFNVPRLNKPDDPHEDALNAGCAYMVEEQEYQKYLDRVKGHPPDMC